MFGKARRHNLSDWLALHDLNPALCRQILSEAAGQIGSQTVGQKQLTSEEYALDADIAWLTVVDAMYAFFPAKRSIIEETFEKTSKVHVEYSNKARRALTLDNGNNGYPTVLYTYSGKASDLLVIAHEFSHALQIVASRGKFVTPIMREVCAFVGEMAILSHSKNTDEIQYLKLRQRWYKDNQKYFISNGKNLDLALRDPHAGYRYYWNYPIARYLARKISKKYTQERIWMLFEGNLSVRQVLHDFGG